MEPKVVQFYSGKALKVSLYLGEDVGGARVIGAESIKNISASEAVADVGQEVGLVLILEVKERERSVLLEDGGKDLSEPSKRGA